MVRTSGHPNMASAPGSGTVRKHLGGSFGEEAELCLPGQFQRLARRRADMAGRRGRCGDGWLRRVFGTDHKAVVKGQRKVHVGRQTGTTSRPSAPLKPKTTYYWRVDEVPAEKDRQKQGPLWSFEVFDGAGQREGYKHGYATWAVNTMPRLTSVTLCPTVSSARRASASSWPGANRQGSSWPFSRGWANVSIGCGLSLPT